MVNCRINRWRLNIEYCIWLCIFQNPCKSRKKRLEEDFFSMRQDVSWLFFSITFCLVFVSYILENYLVVFFDFFFVKCFSRKGRYFSEYYEYLFFVEIILGNLSFLILISDSCLNNFWCYKEILDSFKET